MSRSVIFLCCYRFPGSLCILRPLLAGGHRSWCRTLLRLARRTWVFPLAPKALTSNSPSKWDRFRRVWQLSHFSSSGFYLLKLCLWPATTRVHLSTRSQHQIWVEDSRLVRRSALPSTSRHYPALRPSNLFCKGWLLQRLPTFEGALLLFGTFSWVLALFQISWTRYLRLKFS